MAPAETEKWPVNTGLATCTDCPLSLQGEGWEEGVTPRSQTNMQNNKTGPTPAAKPVRRNDGLHRRGHPNRTPARMTRSGRQNANALGETR